MKLNTTKFTSTLLLTILYIVPFAQQNAMHYAQLSQVTVAGIYADALDASDNGRLKNFITGPESRAIRIYNIDSVKISKSEGWDGECAGKWLYATAKAVQRT